jgi:alkaline phosphatase D
MIENGYFSYKFLYLCTLLYQFFNYLFMKKLPILLFLLLNICFGVTMAQNALVSGPMLGYVEHREALIWAEVSPKVKKAALKYWASSKPSTTVTLPYEGKMNQDFNPIKFTLTGLDINTTYNYQLLLDGKEVKLPYTTAFRTKELWEFRKPAPNFSFLAGSCAYVNDSIYDRPGKPYGSKMHIFETMAKENANFMLWLGDNTYTREVDYSSKWGMNYRYSHTRKLPQMQAFLAKMSHFATWDDHDYGPNNANKSYKFREFSKNLFDNYWGNPSSGQLGQGIYTNLTYGDCEFFLCDDRYFRCDDNLPDSINGKPNVDKEMLGKAQMEWLKNALITSNATFKFICIGSQALNEITPFDAFHHYPTEYYDLLNFISSNKVAGVLFMSGDCHNSKVTKLNRQGAYPLYDIVSSSLTSGTYKINENEKKAIVPGTMVETQNFARISVSGERKNRQLLVEYILPDGQKAAEFKISEKELK